MRLMGSMHKQKTEGLHSGLQRPKSTVSLTALSSYSLILQRPKLNLLFVEPTPVVSGDKKTQQTKGEMRGNKGSWGYQLSTMGRY